MTRLISTRRRVTNERREAYDAAWGDFVEVAEAGGGHAWRFVGSDAADLFIEFLEFSEAPGVERASERLEAVAPAELVEEWKAVERQF